jgi:serine/threonine-protein kinase
MTQLQPGELLRQRSFGQYTVLARLGSGGMGEVYRAKDNTLGREVAIKVLREAVSNSRERLERFETEARTASALNHPNIVTIYEIGTVDDVRYIAMELVEGKTLRELMGSSPLVTRRALQLASQAADGLAQAHAAGIVHRDLKPENIMVTKNGLVKILDFGLAKLVMPTSGSGSGSGESSTGSIDSPGTEPGAILGTVGYMSPEQASGRPVDFRSDQFSCGSILYEMATGKPAFRRGTAVQTMSAIIEVDPEPIANVNPSVPPPLRWIIERCLAKEPEQRYAATSDLARELANVLDHLAEISSGSGRAPSPSGPRRTRHFGAAVGLAMLVALAAGLGPVAARRLRSVEPKLPEKKVLAVLPFDMVGDDASDRALSDGLAENLSWKLTQLLERNSALVVVPASDVRQAKVTTAKEASSRLGANLALVGRLERDRERFHLRADLVETGGLRPLRTIALEDWRSSRGTSEDQIVEKVAGMLEVPIAPQGRQAVVAADSGVTGAYDFYLRGRGYVQRYERAENLETAVGLFQRALELDPRFALAYAGLAEAYWRRYELTRQTQWVELAEKSGGRAVEANDLLAAVHVTRGLIHRGTGHYAEAVKDLNRALDLDPGNADARRELARALDAQGKTQEAESAYREAIALRPDYWAGHSHLGYFYFSHGRYAEAEAQFRRVVELTPDNVGALSNLGGVYHMMGRPDDATAAFRKSLAIQPTPDAFANLGTVLFFQGRYAEAVEPMEKAVALGSADSVLWGNLADAYRRTPPLSAKAPESYRHAVDLARKELEVNAKDASLRSRLAAYLAKLGDKRQALAELATALRQSPKDVDVLFNSALVHELTGQREAAITALEQALAGGYSIDELRKEPDLEALRSDRRYERFFVTSAPGKS